jgi:hypothetical protein
MLKSTTEKVNVFTEFEIHQNVAVKELINYENCVIIYDMVTLDGIFDEIVLTYQYVPTKLKYNEMKCVQMNFNKKKRNITLAVDPNYEHNGKTDMKWQDVRHWCQHFNVEFKNQTFSTLIQELKEEHDKQARLSLSKERKRGLFKRQPYVQHVREEAHLVSHADRSHHSFLCRRR